MKPKKNKPKDITTKIKKLPKPPDQNTLIETLTHHTHTLLLTNGAKGLKQATQDTFNTALNWQKEVDQYQKLTKTKTRKTKRTYHEVGFP